MYLKYEFQFAGDNIIRVVNITIHFSKKDIHPEPLCYQDKLMLEEVNHKIYFHI